MPGVQKLPCQRRDGVSANWNSFALAQYDGRRFNPRMRWCLAFFLILALATRGASEEPGSAPPATDAQETSKAKAPVDQLIPWLLDEDRQLRGVPFSEVIFDTTGKRVLPVDRQNEIDQRVIKAISSACDEAVKRLNALDSPIQKIGRINEVSSHFESMLRELLNSAAGLTCDYPRTADGKVQRSGYPDLRIVDSESKRVFYLDPKLYAAGSRDSSFRTFYFEPKVATNKVRDDAVHFVVGFEHQPSPRSSSAGQPREKSGHWMFTRWDIVDLARFEVKLKAEFGE